MDHVIKRSSTFEADNGSISEGQLPTVYEVRFAADDGILVISDLASGAIEMTVGSFDRLAAEVRRVAGKDQNIGTPKIEYGARTSPLTDHNARCLP